MSLSVSAISTSVFKIGNSLEEFLLKHLKEEILENKILAITSKIVSLAEKRIVSKSEISKKDLVKREADVYLGEGGYDIDLTIKHGILIPSAGIDESNSEGENFILFPEDPFQSAKRICEFLKKAKNLKNFGVLITDSHCQPMRKGVTGVALSYCGFKPTRDLVGKPDIFGRTLKYTSVNVADALAASCVLVMGEANEQKPLALASSSLVEFTENLNPNDLRIPPEQDLFAPVLLQKIKN